MLIIAYHYVPGHMKKSIISARNARTLLIRTFYTR